MIALHWHGFKDNIFAQYTFQIGLVIYQYLWLLEYRLNRCLSRFLRVRSKMLLKKILYKPHNLFSVERDTVELWFGRYHYSEFSYHNLRIVGVVAIQMQIIIMIFGTVGLLKPIGREFIIYKSFLGVTCIWKVSVFFWTHVKEGQIFV